MRIASTILRDRRRVVLATLAALALAVLLAACGADATPTPTLASSPAQRNNPEWKALAAFYNATGGPNWWSNSNWLSDRHISEWDGVTTNAKGQVIALSFSWWDGLRSEMPTELGGLSNLESLSLSGTQLTGEIPAELGSLSNLKFLQLSGNQLSGEIPAELGNLSNLEELRLSGNQLTGCVPASLGSVPNNDFDELGLPFCEDGG
ncbi:MAG: leucine-rich repeat domain-containing protein [Chloroflexota bacterium]|nr:leucine-rich repeat domain-containing protein [Chloroflexota bacterium]